MPSFFYLKKFIKNFLDKKLLMIGKSHILNIRNNYNSITTLEDVDYKVFSQFGEDGIIDFILKQLKINNPKFVEIGVGDYSESNTRFLFENMGGKGLIIDCLSDLENKVKKSIKLWQGELNILEKFVDSSNILELLKENNFDQNLDFFSLDIDGVDYWILNEMPSDFSKVVVAEYNSNFGHEAEVTVPNIKNFERNKYHYSNLCYGMSLKSLINLMEKKNFYFLGSNKKNHNAFFVSKKFTKEKFFPNIIVKDIENYTDTIIRESRDIKGNLNFLSKKDKLKEIENCEVIDVANNLNKKVLLKDITND